MASAVVATAFASGISRKAWLKDTSVNPGGLFSRMGASFLSGEWFAAVT